MSGSERDTQHADCPAEEVVLGWADGTRRDDRATIEAHVATCDRCLDLVAEVLAAERVLAGAGLDAPPPEVERSVGAEARAPDGRPAGIRRLLDALFSYRAAGALAAVSAIALVATFAERSGEPSEAGSPVWRDGTSVGAIVAPVPRAPVGEVDASGDVRFAWSPIPGVERYVVTIVDVDAGTQVAREAVADSAWVLPAARVAAHAGHALEWMVECVDASGRTVTSGAAAVVLRSAPRSD